MNEAAGQKSNAELKKMLDNPAEITKLAKAFSEELREEIGDANLKKAIADNVGEDEGICHSHDYCDANMVMDAAFKKVGVDLDKYSGFPGKGMLGKDNAESTLIAIWNKAWGEAKEKEFFTKETATKTGKIPAGVGYSMSPQGSK
jgi:hypothetical protein